jgi:hypothetical protein
MIVRYGLRSRHQAGLSLIVALIMLIIMTATTLMLFRMSNTGSQIVGNMQFRDEALSAADSTIQDVISTTRMFETPESVFLVDGCNGGKNQRCVDVNGDGTPDVQVDVEPPDCVQVTIIPNARLNLAVDGDRACAEGVRQTFGIAGSAEGNSFCALTNWEVRADASDVGSTGTTGAQVSMVQGVGVRVQRSVALSFCSGS